jgi:hypothetical protein
MDTTSRQDAATAAERQPRVPAGTGHLPGAGRAALPGLLLSRVHDGEWGWHGRRAGWWHAPWSQAAAHTPWQEGCSGWLQCLQAQQAVRQADGGMTVQQADDMYRDLVHAMASTAAGGMTVELLTEHGGPWTYAHVLVTMVSVRRHGPCSACDLPGTPSQAPKCLSTGRARHRGACASNGLLALVPQRARSQARRTAEFHGHRGRIRAPHSRQVAACEQSTRGLIPAMPVCAGMYADARAAPDPARTWLPTAEIEHSSTRGAVCS